MGNDNVKCVRGGFANMPKDRLKMLASMGGKKVQASGNGRRWDVEGAREAGRKGAKALAEKRRLAREATQNSLFATN